MAHDETAREHRAYSPANPLVFHVVTVSDSRGLAADGSGALLAERIAAAGHTVGSREAITDDRDAVRALVQRLVAGGAQVVVLTGGTGFSGRDTTPEAVEPLFTQPIPGFGELFRMLSFAEVGAAAMLSRATAGIVGRTPVFALPGSPAACRLAVEKLILPEIGHLCGQLARHRDAPATPVVPAAPPEPAPAPAPTAPPDDKAAEKPVPRGLSIVEVPTPKRPAAPELKEGQLGWQRAVATLEGVVHKERHPTVPPGLAKLAPLVDVLDTAGQTATLALPDGREYGLYGWPDLERSGSRVLALRATDGPATAELLALHRMPLRVGTSVERQLGEWARRDEPPGAVCQRLLGRTPRDPSGAPFATVGDAVWILRGNRVIRFTNVGERDDGTPSQVLASLALRWSAG